MSRIVVGRRRIPNRSRLRTEVNAFNANAKRKETVLHWGFTKMDARREFGYKCAVKGQGVWRERVSLGVEGDVTMISILGPPQEAKAGKSSE